MEQPRRRATPFISRAQLARRAEVPEDVVKDIFDVLLAYMEEGTEVRVHGFGRFRPTRYEARRWSSPVLPERAAEKIGGRRILFKMSPSLRGKWRDDAQPTPLTLEEAIPPEVLPPKVK